MRLAFMGSAEFGVPALAALLDAGHEIAAVYAPPARPAGRGGQTADPPLARFAARRGLPLRRPARLKQNSEEWAAFQAFTLDAAIVAAYRLILPAEMLGIPALGALNIHASLLPRWRGAAPIQAAILAGDAETGVTIMRMEEGLDTGPILLAQAVPIPPDATGASLTETLAALGARLIVEALAQNPAPCAQDEAKATYASRLSRADGRIDWKKAAFRLGREVRAYAPWPGSFCVCGATTLKVLTASADPGAASAPPGTILDPRFRVACGEGALELVLVQVPGGKPTAGAAFLRGRGRSLGISVGARLA